MALPGAVWWVGNNQAYCHLDAWLLKIWDCGLSESQRLRWLGQRGYPAEASEKSKVLALCHLP